MCTAGPWTRRARREIRQHRCEPWELLGVSNVVWLRISLTSNGVLVPRRRARAGPAGHGRGRVPPLPAAGWLISRPGSRVVKTAGAVGLSAAIIPPALALRANGGPRCPGVQSGGTAHATLRTHGG